MGTKISLIIKVIDNQSISIIAEENKLPQEHLSNLHPDVTHTLNYLRDKYKIHPSYFTPRLVHFGVNEEPTAYYSILLPKEFLDETLLNKVNNSFDQFSPEDSLAIRQGLFVS